MIVLLSIEAHQGAAAEGHAAEYRWLKLHGRNQNRKVELLIDVHGVRLRSPTAKGLISAESIEELALVWHGRASCTLLMLSNSGFHTRVFRESAANTQQLPSQYLELGTIFNDEPATRQLAEQLEQLGYRVAQYNWSEFLGKLPAA